MTIIRLDLNVRVLPLRSDKGDLVMINLSSDPEDSMSRRRLKVNHVMVRAVCVCCVCLSVSVCVYVCLCTHTHRHV